jgi:hypothetical protein
MLIIITLGLKIKINIMNKKDNKKFIGRIARLRDEMANDIE